MTELLVTPEIRRRYNALVARHYPGGPTMQPARPSLLEALARLLPGKASGAAKALIPLVLALLGVGVQVVTTGQFDTAAEATAITGAAMSGLTYLVPNVKAEVPLLTQLTQQLVDAALKHVQVAVAAAGDRLRRGAPLERLVDSEERAPVVPSPPTSDATPAPPTIDLPGFAFHGLPLAAQGALADVATQLRAAPAGATIVVQKSGEGGEGAFRTEVPPA